VAASAPAPALASTLVPAVSAPPAAPPGAEGLIFEVSLAVGSLGINLQKRTNSMGEGRIVVTSSAGQSLAAGIQLNDELMAMYLGDDRGWAEVR
jgi:hypothetical protein